MEYLLMLVAGGILLASIWIGWRKGFLKMTLSMVAFIIAIIATWVFSPKVTDVLRTMTPLYSITQKAVKETLEENLDFSGELTLEEQKQVLEESFLPSYMVDVLSSRSEAASDNSLDTKVFLGRVADYVAGIVLNICGVILTFALAGLVIHLITLLLSVVDLIPGLHVVNKVGGAGIGFVQGLIWIWILCFVITLLSPTKIGQEMLMAIENNAFLNAVYNGVLSFSSILKFGLVLF